ncbi:MAG: hypothetical protein LBQ77_08240 [Treponema sp.]|nr:hypothetical protein [Treponema sp.]
MKRIPVAHWNRNRLLIEAGTGCSLELESGTQTDRFLLTGMSLQSYPFY